MTLVRKGESFVELAIDKPAEVLSKNLLIVSPSGRFSNDRNWETSLYCKLAQRLEKSAATLLVSAIPCERKPETPAPAAERTARAKVLLETIKFAVEGNPDANVCLMGLSLGSQVIVDVVSQVVFCNLPIGTLILVSLVLEEPVFIHVSNLRGYLVYGANDGVAYLNQDGSVGSVLRPSQYSQMTKANLFLLQSQPMTVEIIEGAGHLLETGDGDETSVSCLHRLAVSSFTNNLQAKTYEYISTAI